MYDRYIERRLGENTGLAFIDRINYVEIDVSVLPDDVMFYVEFMDDWWIERHPFINREKNEDVRHTAQKLLEQAKIIWDKQQEELKNITPLTKEEKLKFIQNNVENW